LAFEWFEVVVADLKKKLGAGWIFNGDGNTDGDARKNYLRATFSTAFLNSLVEGTFNVFRNVRVQISILLIKFVMNA
jgi:hypothetical protein